MKTWASLTQLCSSPLLRCIHAGASDSKTTAAALENFATPVLLLCLETDPFANKFAMKLIRRLCSEFGWSTVAQWDHKKAAQKASIAFRLLQIHSTGDLSVDSANNSLPSSQE